MSVKAMAWAWEQDVPMSTKGVLLALADHADNDGTCWPGVKGIAEKCRLSPRTVRYHLKVLRKAGLIIAEERRRDDGTQTSNIYHLPVNILTPTLQSLSPPPAILDRGTLQSLTPHEPSLEPSRESSEHILQKEYVHILREVPGWMEKGEPHLGSLLKWAIEKGHTDAVIERSAIGLASVQKKTLVGYTNLVSALQKRINNGYDDPTKQRSPNGAFKQNSQTNSQRSGARFDNSLAKYIEAQKSDIRPRT